MKKVSKKEKKITKSVLKRAVKQGPMIKIYDLEGREKQEVKLPKEIFDTKASNKLLSQYVRIYLANQRQGTAATKTRGEVRGSTRKIYRQKGTGKARHGDIKAPIFVGGGVVGGPKPRDYSLKINKKQKKKALFYALSLTYKNRSIMGLSDEALKIEPKTKKIATFLKLMKLYGKKTLLVLPKIEKNNLILAARNIHNLELTDAQSLNAYMILKNKEIIFINQALKVLENHFLKKNENK